MTDEIISRIEEDIVFGVYPPGGKLVEDQLGERFGLSRYNLRSALSILQEKGLVEKIPNRGVRVIEPTPKEIDELYEIRLLLESHAASQTPLPAHPSLIESLEVKHQEHKEAAAKGDLRAVFRHNLAFHSIQFSACPNEKLRDAIEQYARKVHIVRAVKYFDASHLERVIQQHAAIVSSLRGSDTWTYVQAVREHIPASSQAYRTAYELKYGVSGVS